MPFTLKLVSEAAMSRLATTLTALQVIQGSAGRHEEGAKFCGRHAGFLKAVVTHGSGHNKLL